MKNSEEFARKLIEIDKKLYENLTRFNQLKEQREKILQKAEENKFCAELQVEMETNIKEFDEVLKTIQCLEKQTLILKKLI